MKKFITSGHGPVHEISVLIALANSEGSGE